LKAVGQPTIACIRRYRYIGLIQAQARQPPPDPVDGTLILENDVVELHGMVSGDLIVRDKAVVHLHGMICGDAIVEAGELRLHGMVNGNVSTLGGYLCPRTHHGLLEEEDARRPASRKKLRASVRSQTLLL
jgi:hypothetical protein